MNTRPRRHPRPSALLPLALGLAFGIIGGCVVDLADEDEDDALLGDDEADASDAAADGGEPGSCGCVQPWGPQDGDTYAVGTAPARGPVASSRLTANCHEVVAPWCGAQIGCTYQKTTCDWRDEFDTSTMTLTGFIIWTCTDVPGATDIRKCTAV